ncbi:hypothetical protein ACFV0A_36575, partial [Streptomyces sp. NPDC059552]
MVGLGAGATVSVGVGEGPAVVGGGETDVAGGEFGGVADGRRDGVRAGVRPGVGARLWPGTADCAGGAETGGSGAGSFLLTTGAVVGAVTVGVRVTDGPSAGGEVSEELSARLTTVP